ncbi:MAG: hypothetical protein P8L45_07780 [Longimicrobiales bacterium]|nr:hypothetical protein [Longimicrobiales bacterium]
MSQTDCGTIRECLPDFAAGRLDDDAGNAVTAHLPTCAECRAELELIQMLLAAPPMVPAALEDQLTTAVRTSRQPTGRPWWGISAAAVAALALGIGVSTDRPEAIDGPVPDFASETGEGELWPSDDGLLAGEPSLDGLSDEALIELLEELTGEGAA